MLPGEYAVTLARMEIVIHIGFPKTGSTAIQAHLATNWQWFGARGLYIPKSGFTPGSGHNYLFTARDTRNPNPELAAYLGHTGYLQALLAELEYAREQGFERVLLSWEGFAILDLALVRKLASGFSGHRVRLLAYLREQSELVESLILQRVKSVLWKSHFFDYLEGRAEPPAPGFLDFHKVLSCWKQGFAEDLAVETRIFNRSALLGQDVIVDFVGWLGLAVDDSFTLQPADTNASLDPAGAGLASLASAAGLDRRGKAILVQALLRDRVAHPAGAGSFLPKAALAGIRARYRQSNQNVLREFPPANQGPVPELFPRAPRRSQPRPDPLLQFARRLNTLIQNPQPMLWLGEELDRHTLSSVTDGIGRGWRRPGARGIWSVNDSSEIIFRIPRVNLDSGPVRLLLAVRGNYYGDNSSTVVEYGEQRDRRDLRSATISLPVDENTLRLGVHLTLIHDNPVSPLESENKKDSDRLAFLLTSLEYQFAWS
ncbi:MAG: hypothetical protein H6985_10825 [Pseudomonadales bacterium]|nr:hypothetical protein [Pseudomonadales bacterium]